MNEGVTLGKSELGKAKLEAQTSIVGMVSIAVIAVFAMYFITRILKK